MGHYSRNLLEEDWDANSAAEHAERVAKAEEEAGWYFARATKDQKAEYDATMRDLLGLTGPRWNRAREAAMAKWRADTAPARELFERTFEELMRDGEVSEATSFAWDELAKEAADERSAA